MEHLTLILVLTIASVAATYLPTKHIVERLVSLHSHVFPTAKTTELAKLHKERVQVLKERDALSPQDNYAKWTKLNRKLDAVTEKVQKSQGDLGGYLSGIKANYESGVKYALNGTYWLLRFYVGWRSVVVFIPRGLFGSWVDMFVVNAVGGVRGGLGIVCWLAAVNCVVGVVIDGARALLKFQQQQQPEKAPVDPTAGAFKEPTKSQ
ncbi:hypothetical protein DAMA08_014830 [Martiniozyma asiatica (nom. inval.)]|nr:hypothetical protein DAMA08_014830 [Martiniozyma asiatica]